MMKPSLCFALFLALFFASSLTYSEENTPCTTLLQTKCLDCHFETRICQKLKKKKSVRSWKKTIKKMVKNGADMNSKDQKTLAHCLGTPSKNVKQFCGVGTSGKK